MELHFKIVGVILILLAFIHIFFPKYFDWKNNLSSLTLINRQMMKTHTFFIALVVLLMGFLYLFESKNLVNTELGKTICLGLGIFWTFRLYFQFFVYSKKLWSGKLFESTVHILFSLFWAYISAINWITYLL